MISLKDISVTFNQSKKPAIQAVKNVSIEIDKGTYGIVGYQAGKSTLVRVINLLQRPSSGSVVVNGTELTTLSAKDLREKRKTIE